MCPFYLPAIGGLRRSIVVSGQFRKERVDWRLFAGLRRLSRQITAIYLQSFRGRRRELLAVRDIRPSWLSIRSSPEFGKAACEDSDNRCFRAMNHPIPINIVLCSTVPEKPRCNRTPHRIAVLASNTRLAGIPALPSPLHRSSTDRQLDAIGAGTIQQRCEHPTQCETPR